MIWACSTEHLSDGNCDRMCQFQNKKIKLASLYSKINRIILYGHMALDRTRVKSVTKSGDEYCRVCGEYVIHSGFLVYTVKGSSPR